MTYNELKLYKPLSEITYFDLLNCEEWRIKRAEILKRDNHKCTQCKKSKTLRRNFLGVPVFYNYQPDSITIYQSDAYTTLHVHHKLYIYNKLPWDYSQKHLITLCNQCHDNFHQKNSVEVWDQHELNKISVGYCSRCSGNGYLSEYRRIQNGICFKCQGYGYDKHLINMEDL